MRRKGHPGRGSSQDRGPEAGIRLRQGRPERLGWREGWRPVEAASRTPVGVRRILTVIWYEIGNCWRTLSKEVAQTDLSFQRCPLLLWG